MWYSVDVEADGPIPGEYSMISFGIVVVEPGLHRTFYKEVKPISEKWIPEALAVSGFSREKTLGFEEPAKAMQELCDWVVAVQGHTNSRPMFLSDNNGFDWQFVNYYLWKFAGRNPFGHSSTNLGSLYKGMQKDTFQNFKHLRKTRHTHNALDDAKGNAEALLEMKKMGLKINLGG